MEIKYDQIKFEADDFIIAGLEKYAKNILRKMQEVDPEFAECWTACNITFDELQPNFVWGSIEDIDEDVGIYVALPLSA
jgi:hypothetical protein